MYTDYTICYVSKVASSVKEKDIEALFKWTTAWNNSKHIKGILLTANGNFFQVLEGEKELLTSLYERIKEDKRHEDIYEVFNRPITKSVFKNYNSTFNVVKSIDELEQIKVYLDSMPFDSTSEKLSRLLGPFLLMQEL